MMIVPMMVLSLVALVLTWSLFGWKVVAIVWGASSLILVLGLLDDMRHR